MNELSSMRNPSDIERHIFSTLTDLNFPGSDSLREAMRHVVVKTIDDNGSLELRDVSLTSVDTIKQIPVEGTSIDSDEIVIHILLHVRNNTPVELEIYKEDGSIVKNKQSFMNINAFFLPPHPEKN